MDEMLTRKEAADYLKISRNTAYQLFRSGAFGRKVGGQWRVARAELDRWMRGGAG